MALSYPYTKANTSLNFRLTGQIKYKQRQVRWTCMKAGWLHSYTLGCFNCRGTHISNTKEQERDGKRTGVILIPLMTLVEGNCIWGMGMESSTFFLRQQQTAAFRFLSPVSLARSVPSVSLPISVFLTPSPCFWEDGFAVKRNPPPFLKYQSIANTKYLLSHIWLKTKGSILKEWQKR